MKKSMLCLMFMVAMVVTTGCNNNRQAKEKTIWVKTAVVTSDSIQDKLQFPARVKAAKEVNAAFKIDGKVQQIFVDEGNAIVKGELLATIDPRDYELQLKAMEAEYSSRKAEAERVFALYADSVATKADYDKARYGLQQISAKYDNAKNRLADTRLYAPFDGWVKRRLSEPTMVIAAGMPVLKLISSAMPELEINIPSSVYNRRKNIEAFHARFDYIDKPVPLHLISIAPDVNATQLHSVRLALPDTMKEMPAAGMSAMVDLMLGKENDKDMRIAATAIVNDGSNCFVWTVEGGRAVKRKVDVKELHSDGTTTIAGDLGTGDTIVTAGVQSLIDNIRIKSLPQRRGDN